jgi:phosphoribosylanthranilate isomerase
MHTIKVKICGITNLDDAVAAVDMGADMLGFNFYEKSPRYIKPKKAEKIINSLPGFVETVGLFVDAPIENIHKIGGEGWMNWAQLHGDQSPEFCDKLNEHHVKTMKAIRVRTPMDIRQAEKFHTDAILLDAWHQDKYGGTGQRFDWSFLEDTNVDYFLAGGINSDNIEEALKLGVYGVDICSGVESSPGKKDHKKMQKIFDKINQFNSGMTLYGYKL